MERYAKEILTLHGGTLCSVLFPHLSYPLEFSSLLNFYRRATPAPVYGVWTIFGLRMSLRLLLLIISQKHLEAREIWQHI